LGAANGKLSAGFRGRYVLSPRGGSAGRHGRAGGVEHAGQPSL